MDGCTYFYNAQHLYISKIYVYVPMRIKVTTTIDPEIHEMATDKSIKWSDALTRGIILMAKERLPPPQEEIISKEVANLEIQKLRTNMSKLQDIATEKSEEVGDLKNAILELEKKKAKRSR